MISHTYAFIVLYVCVAPCGMYVKKRAFWYEIRHNVHKFIVNAARKSKVDDNTAKMQSIKQLGV